MPMIAPLPLDLRVRDIQTLTAYTHAQLAAELASGDMRRRWRTLVVKMRADRAREERAAGLAASRR